MGDKQCTHYWIVDNKDVGRCRHCGAVEDFGALMRREERKSALKTVSPVKSAAAKERWQDPEYQVKQIAAQKKQWQNPEYRAKRSTTHTGKRHTAETKAKISTALTRFHNERG
ncbi:MAG: hypothetical protein KAW00_01110 [Dehalococcoidia bacterium]|nr:hypothetical protein [Dehalococcoidia bacterium]